MTKHDTKEIFQTTDYKGRPVILTAERKKHIEEGRGLEETNTWPQAIKDTIEDPDMVVADDYDDTEIHCKLDAGDETTNGNWMIVPVGYQLGIGNVKTAFQSNKPAKQKNTVCYLKPGYLK